MSKGAKVSSTRITSLLLWKLGEQEWYICFYVIYWGGDIVHDTHSPTLILPRSTLLDLLILVWTCRDISLKSLIARSGLSFPTILLVYLIVSNKKTSKYVSLKKDLRDISLQVWTGISMSIRRGSLRQNVFSI